jgi:hypothetical protein
VLPKRARSFSVILITIIVLLSACTSLQTEPNKASTTPQNQTGVAELDRIIAIALKGNVVELRSILGFTQTKCTFADGLGGPPKCLDGEQEGTPVEVLPFLGPEGYFVRKADIGSWKGVNMSELFAVYQVSDMAFSDENYPAGEYAIVFIGDPENKTSITLQIRQGRIVRIDNGFGYPPEIRQDAVIRYLVPPINTNP